MLDISLLKQLPCGNEIDFRQIPILFNEEGNDWRITSQAMSSGDSSNGLNSS